MVRIVMLLCAIAVFSLGLSVSAQSNCPAGTQPATATDVAIMKAAGIASAQVGMCWSPSDTNIGQAAGDAKTWLRQHATTASNIACMNSAFAEKLKKFMEAVPGGPPTITDGYRDPGKQAALVASGASRAGYCHSYHNYGLAADFNNNRASMTAWMRANASSYGIKTIGTWDPNHFEDADGIHGQCGSCANMDPGANGVIQSAQGGSTGEGSQVPTSPSGPQTASTVPASAPGTISPSDIFPTATTSPVTIQTPTLVVNLLTPSSTADILNALAHPNGATTSTTTTDGIALNPALSTSILVLQASHIPGVTVAQVSSNYSPSVATETTGTIAGTRPVSGADTFIYSDVNAQDTFTQSPALITSDSNNVLDSLKVQLIAALGVLAVYAQPFQGNIPSQFAGE